MWASGPTSRRSVPDTRPAAGRGHGHRARRRNPRGSRAATIEWGIPSVFANLPRTGSVPERPKGTGCKPVGLRLRRFKSSSAHAMRCPEIIAISGHRRVLPGDRPHAPGSPDMGATDRRRPRPGTCDPVEPDQLHARPSRFPWSERKGAARPIVGNGQAPIEGVCLGKLRLSLLVSSLSSRSSRACSSLP